MCVKRLNGRSEISTIGCGKSLTINEDMLVKKKSIVLFKGGMLRLIDPCLLLVNLVVNL